MSNPIADTAEYFSEKRNNSKPNLRIFPSQDLQSSSPHDLISPESPESRRRPHIPSHMSDFDPKLQWQKVLKRLPNRHENTQESDSDHSSNNDEAQPTGQDSYRMRRRSKKQQPYYDDRDDVLPDTEDLNQQEETDQSDIMPAMPQPEQPKLENYFVNPFQSSSTGTNSSDDISKTTADTSVKPDNLEPSTSKKLKKKKKKQIKEGADHEHMVSSSTSDSSSDNDSQHTPTAATATTTTMNEGMGRARKHWGKTLDKVRLIANLHTLPHQPKKIVHSTPSLAPYYPPLFDPVFIALSKDQHGRPWVSYLHRDRVLYLTVSFCPYSHLFYFLF
jgi:hypothetical protein